MNVCERCGTEWESAHGITDCLRIYDANNGTDALKIYKLRLLGIDENGNKIPPLNIFNRQSKSNHEEDGLWEEI